MRTKHMKWCGVAPHRYPRASTPPCAQFDANGAVRSARVDGLPRRAPLSLRLDPSRNVATPHKRVSTEIIDHADHPRCRKALWNTPRAGKPDGSRTLTVRSERDLPTAVRFEASTPFVDDGRQGIDCDELPYT